MQRGDYCAVIPDFYPVIPAKAGIQMACGRRSRRPSIWIPIAGAGRAGSAGVRPKSGASARSAPSPVKGWAGLQGRVDDPKRTWGLGKPRDFPASLAHRQGAKPPEVRQRLPSECYQIRRTMRQRLFGRRRGDAGGSRYSLLSKNRPFAIFAPAPQRLPKSPFL